MIVTEIFIPIIISYHLPSQPQPTCFANYLKFFILYNPRFLLQSLAQTSPESLPTLDELRHRLIEIILSKIFSFPIIFTNISLFFLLT